LLDCWDPLLRFREATGGEEQEAEGGGAHGRITGSAADPLQLNTWRGEQ
jgi:hypothetical protein